ncbi:MAG: Ig-like domain-containing protein, partial [Pseudomonadota bacterium]
SNFAASIQLAALEGSNGFIINGVDAGDGSGLSVSSGGDINDDGVDDLIIGAAFADPLGQSNAGESYVVFGSDSGFDPLLNLSDLNGANGFVMNGIDIDDLSGTAVTGLGDVNGDGISDLLIGAYGADPDGALEAGESYLVFGSDAGFAAEIDLSSLDGSNGYILNGAAAGDQSGRAVASAGDINGDGIADLIIGSPGASPGGDQQAGQATVIFGGALQLALADFAGGAGDGVIELADIGVDALGFSLRTTPDDVLSIADLSLLENDIDELGDGLEIVDVSAVSSLGAAVSFNGFDVIYDPDGAFASLGNNEQVVDTFTYEVVDGAGETDTATVSIIVSNPQNTPEISTVDFQPVTEGDTAATIVSFDLASILTAKDIDPGDTPVIDELSISIDVATGSDVASAGDFVLNGSVLSVDTASFNTLSAEQFGLFDVTFDVVSGDDRVSASTRITIVGENDALQLAADPITVTMLDSDPVQTIDVLGNVIDPDLADDFTVTSAVVTTSRSLLFEDFSDEVANAGGGSGGILVQNIDAPALDQFFVAQGSVDLQNQFSGGAGPELDLDGTATVGSDDPAGQITSNESFTFQPGFDYTLSFDLRSIADDEIVALSVGSLLNETITSGSLERFTIEFQATSTETAPLSFTNLGANDNLGAAISNISLSESAAVEIDGASGNLLFDPSIFNDALGSGQSQVVSIDYSVSDGTEDVSGSVVLTVNGTGSDMGAGYGSRVFGAEAGDQSGQSVSNIGDINGDGFDDIVIGAPLADYSGTYGYSNAGAAFVVFGNGDMDTLAEIDLGNLDGLNGFRVQYGY